MTDFLLLAVIAGLFGGGAGALAGFLLVRGSGPVATAQGLAEMLRLRMEWEGWKKGAEAVLEGMADLEEVIERKRTRLAARESKAKAAEPGPADERTALIARARALGHPV